MILFMLIKSIVSLSLSRHPTSASDVIPLFAYVVGRGRKQMQLQIVQPYDDILGGQTLSPNVIIYTTMYLYICVIHCNIQFFFLWFVASTMVHSGIHRGHRKMRLLCGWCVVCAIGSPHFVGPRCFRFVLPPIVILN